MSATACPACLSARAAPAMKVAGWEFLRCGDCSTLWVAEPPVEVDGIYRDAGYYTDKPEMDAPGGGIAPGYTGDYLRERPNVEAKFSGVLEHVERYVEPGRLLDVGCGPGFLLAAARGRGWEVRGVDVNEWAARYAREELGLDVAARTLADAAFADQAFDAVTMMDVVEHVAAPAELVSEAARITRPGGVLAILTPDAGASVSRAMGRRWPEVRRAGEHLVLLSLRGAVALVERCGFRAVGWHYIGKVSSVATLVEDVGLAVPGAARLAPVVARTPLGRATLDLDPHTKFVLYAKRVEAGARSAPTGGGVAGPGATPARLPEQAARPPLAKQRPRPRLPEQGPPPDLPEQAPLPVRLPKRAPQGRGTEEAVLEELRELARAEGLCDWMFEQYAPFVRGQVVEVGAGIGTFSARALDAGAERMLLIEPEEGCAGELRRRFAGDDRVQIARELLPRAPSLRALEDQADLVFCQNVLEHIEDDHAAVAAMAAALRPGGTLSLLVPALPRLYGSLDVVYGHWRRYTRGSLRGVVEAAGLDLTDLYHFNALAIPGWWLKNRTGSAGIGPLALRAYEAAVAGWSAIERRRRPPIGLSLIAHARKP